MSKEISDRYNNFNSNNVNWEPSTLDLLSIFSFSRFEWCPNNFSSRAYPCPGERFVLFNNKPILSVSISIQVTLPCESPKLHVRRLEWRCRGCFSISASKESRLAGADTRFRLVCLSFVTRAELKSFHLGKMKLSLFNDCPKYLITNKKFVLVKIKLKRKSLLLESKVFYVKNESHIETRSEIQKVYKENYWHGLKHMTDILI